MGPLSAGGPQKYIKIEMQQIMVAVDAFYLQNLRILLVNLNR